MVGRVKTVGIGGNAKRAMTPMSSEVNDGGIRIVSQRRSG
jgi:hypothetical protein